MLLGHINSWLSNEATSKAVKHVQYSHNSAPMDICGGTGKSLLTACACVRLNAKMSYHVTPVLGFTESVPLLMLSISTATAKPATDLRYNYCHCYQTLQRMYVLLCSIVRRFGGFYFKIKLSIFSKAHPCKFLYSVGGCGGSKNHTMHNPW